MIIFFTACVFAQGRISVESGVDRSTVLIGDVILYTISIYHDPDVQIRKPGFAANLDMFEVRDFRDIEPEKADGQIVEKLEYKLSTFLVGEYDIPELEIKYMVEPDSVYQSIKTEPIRITVESLNPDEAGDIRDIKPPITPPRDYKELIYYGLGALLLAGLIFLGIYYYKKRKAGESLLPRRQPPPRPAHEIALDALDALEEKGLLAEGKIKQFYTELSEIIREYINNRFYIFAMEMTTLQLLTIMREEKLQKQDIELMAEFLQACDLVKFAKHIPSEQDHVNNVQSARQFVDQTKLVFEQEAEPELQDETEAPQIEQVETKEEN
ncbi:hypothetical protein JW935_24930 [candidate division KSB1 bacterium]|nr:hypothetical protein [candidate division KSB1 bacterium]